MSPGVRISNQKLIFTEYPVEDIGLMKYCKSFEIELTSITAIAISPRLALDDEEVFILIISSSLEILPMPSNVLRSEGMSGLEKSFKLRSIRKEWQKFGYNDHYGKHDKILYPPELYWRELFKNDLKLKLRKILGAFVMKNFWGNFTSDIEALTN